MRHAGAARLIAVMASASLILLIAAPVSAAKPSPTTWYSGQRTFANVSVEPAVNTADGSEIFLHTPIKAPTNANPRAHAPLYLVLYPNASSLDAAVLNCTPANCDHANAWPYPGGLKGHDHLVGVPPTGDWNVAWDVYAVYFTAQGFQDLAINTRILTLDQLTAALAGPNPDAVIWTGPNGGTTPFILLSFQCSRTSVADYLKGTPYVFPG